MQRWREDIVLNTKRVMTYGLLEGHRERKARWADNVKTKIEPASIIERKIVSIEKNA